MAFAAPVILWGADAPSDKLRQCALHRLRQQGRDAQAPDVGRQQHRLHAVSDRRLN